MVISRDDAACGHSYINTVVDKWSTVAVCSIVSSVIIMASSAAGLLSLVLSVFLLGVRGTTTSSMSNTSSTTASSVCSSEYSCADCNTVRICAPTSTGQLHQITAFACPTATPWCEPDTGSCTDVEPLTCGNSSTSFICMRDGVFPDVNDCSRYYQCKDDVAVMYLCEGDKPYYSPYYQACMSTEYSGYCASNGTDCSGLSGVKLPVSSRSDELFAYCVDGEVLTVDRCIGGYRYDNYTQNCEMNCPHEGLFPDDRDCTMYYRCSPAAGARHYDMTTDLSCPTGEAFSELQYECVDQDLVANCNVTSGAFNARRIIF